MQPDVIDHIRVGEGVYAPQADSRLLCSVLSSSARLGGARVLDLCTGSGVVAIHAAALGARQVIAYDIDESAVQCARDNANRFGVEVDIQRGTLDDALPFAPYDVVVSNPPYVPSPAPPVGAGLHRAWDAGADGRSVLDTLCTNAAALLSPGGLMLVVQSEFAGTAASVERLRAGGLRVDVARRARIPFGPVMLQRAEWLESTGALEPGRRTEELVVLRAERLR